MLDNNQIDAILKQIADLNEEVTRLRILVNLIKIQLGNQSK